MLDGFGNGCTSATNNSIADTSYINYRLIAETSAEVIILNAAILVTLQLHVESTKTRQCY